ncbi:serine protease [Rickettsiales bacterium]|nr:serine protease [Rickettsiales bacterium]
MATTTLLAMCFSASIVSADTISSEHKFVNEQSNTGMMAYVKPPKKPEAHSFDKLSRKKDYQHFTSGTGFFVTKNHIITNEHVVQGCKYVRVRGAVHPSHAKIVSSDPINDLALLYTAREPIQVASLRGNVSLDIGEDVNVIGYPLERGISGEYSIQRAKITSIADPYSGANRMQFTDTVQKGNSGGPLLDTNGTVVGVIVGKMSFYLADDDMEKAAPVKTSSVAIGLDSLKGFLASNKIFYRIDNTKNKFAEGWMERKAKDYVVNIHCVKD